MRVSRIFQRICLTVGAGILVLCGAMLAISTWGDRRLLLGIIDSFECLAVLGVLLVVVGLYRSRIYY